MSTKKSLSLPRRRDPWNKGRLIGQKRPLKPKDVWTIRVRVQLEARKRNLAMFNSRHRQQAQALRPCSGEDRRRMRRREGSRSSDRDSEEDRPAGAVRDHRADPECYRQVVGRVRCPQGSRAVSGKSRICRHGIMPASSVDGWSALAPIVPRTAPLRCAEQSPLKFTGRPATCERYSCTATRSWRAPSAILESSWTTLSPSRSRWSVGPSEARAVLAHPGAAVHRMPRRLRSEPDFFFARVPGPVAYGDHRWPRSWRRGKCSPTSWCSSG